jgi:hypothetical protein
MVKSATRYVSLQQWILALLVLQRISYLLIETYPYDAYHKGDVTLVTLGSYHLSNSCVLAEW